MEYSVTQEFVTLTRVSRTSLGSLYNTLFNIYKLSLPNLMKVLEKIQVVRENTYNLPKNLIFKSIVSLLERHFPNLFSESTIKRCDIFITYFNSIVFL